MISFNNVKFKYRTKKEIQLDVPEFSIKDGECILLTGVSGSGKSTITKCINGLIPEFFEGDFLGEVFINNTSLNTLHLYEISKFVGSVFQDPTSQFFTDHAITELAFACENYGIEVSEIKKRMAYAIKVLGIEHLLKKKLKAMSNGEKQKIAIASTLTLLPTIVLFDEPSSNLDYASIKMLSNIIKELKAKGLTIIIAEHRIYYLKDIFDRVIYVEDGKIEKEFSSEEFKSLTNDALHNLGLRSLDVFSNIPKRLEKEYDKTAISLKNISYSYKDSNKKIFNNLSLDLYKGDITALVGKNGIGKTTLLRIISGIYKQDEGSIFINGKDLNNTQRIKNINFVMNDIDYQLFGDTVYNELLIGHIETDELHKKIESTLKKLNLYEFRNSHPTKLSSGQKQRLVIAASYIKDSAVTILDEPTSGLDYRNMLKVSALLSELAENNNAVLIVSHDYEFITNTCDRIILLDEQGIKSDTRLSENNMILKNIFSEF